MRNYFILFLKALGFIAVFAFLEFLVQPIAYLIAGKITNDYIITLIQLALELGGALLAVKIFIGRGKFNKIGFNKRVDKKLILKMILYGLLFNCIVNLLILGLRGYSFEAFIWNRLFVEDVIIYMIIGIISAATGAVVEEFPIRGYIFNLFNKHSEYAALIITAVLYAIIHLIYGGIYFPYALGLILFSILLSFIYMLTGNIAYNTTFFAGWFFANTFIFSTTESEALSPGIMFLTNTDKNLINGGTYGIYGSLVFIAGILALDIYMFYLLRKKGHFCKRENSVERA